MSPFGKCTHVVQVRFAGTRPVPVMCDRDGTFRPSLIHAGTGVVRCDSHHVEHSGRRRRMLLELPIPGVW